MRRIYEGLGVANDLVFFELDPDGYDRVSVGEENFAIPKGRDHFAECRRQCFPSETAGIDRVSRSGLAAAAAALGCEPEELLTATGQSLRIYPAEDPSS